MKKPPKLPRHQPDADYEVGYAKPPKDTRFKPGRSGNPAGRPRGAKNKRPRLNEERLKEIIIDEAYRHIKVRDGDRQVSVPMAQAIVRAVAVNAAKGHYRAQRLFADMLATTERENKALADEWLKTAIEYKVDWEQELHRRKVNGVTCLPDPIPHPDHIKIDMSTGEVRIEGPITKEDKDQLDALRSKRDSFEEERSSILELLKTEDDPGARQIMEEDLEYIRKVIDTFDKVLGKFGTNSAALR